MRYAYTFSVACAADSLQMFFNLLEFGLCQRLFFGFFLVSWLLVSVLVSCNGRIDQRRLYRFPFSHLLGIG